MEEEFDITEIHRNCFEYLWNNYKYHNGPMFMVRQRNNKDRLSKGYYFLGNENYVHISFWNGGNWKEKIYSIGFVIWEDGGTYLEITGSVNEESGVYFGKLANHIKNVLGYEYKKTIKKQWVHIYDNEYYLDSLKQFVENDKILIDSFIENNQVELVSSIDEKRFLKSIEKFEKIKFENPIEGISFKNEDSSHVEKISSYDMTRLHNIIQNRVAVFLREKTSYTNIKLENNFIDISGINDKGEIEFFEVKTGEVKSAIRQAIGQLLEYNHYPNENRAHSLIVVTEREPKEEDKVYIKFLRKEYKLPLYLQVFNLDKNELSEKY